LSGDDLEVVCALLERHHEYEQKVGAGIQRIFVKCPPPTYGSNIKPMRCFYIERVDSTEVAFSYKKCLEGEGSGIERREKLVEKRRQSAYRTAVDDQVIAFKQQHQHEGCANGCTRQKDLHVDHILPFADLVLQYEQQDPEPPPSQFEEDHTYHKKRFRIEDEEFTQRWREFHKQHAKLRILCSQCNLRRKRGSRVRD